MLSGAIRNGNIQQLISLLPKLVEHIQKMVRLLLSSLEKLKHVGNVHTVKVQ